MQPRQMRETSRPLRPRFTYSIIRSPTDHRPKGTELAHTLRKIFCNKKALITLPPRRDRSDDALPAGRRDRLRVAALACRDWQGSADAFVQVRSRLFAGGKWIRTLGPP